jgi:hypothetical protein
MFFVAAKIIEIHLKGVKITQNRSKAWAIVHAFWSNDQKCMFFAPVKIIDINFGLFSHQKSMHFGEFLARKHGL